MHPLATGFVSWGARQPTNGPVDVGPRDTETLRDALTSPVDLDPGGREASICHGLRA